MIGEIKARKWGSRAHFMARRDAAKGDQNIRPWGHRLCDPVVGAVAADGVVSIGRQRLKGRQTDLVHVFRAEKFDAQAIRLPGLRPLAAYSKIACVPEIFPSHDLGGMGVTDRAVGLGATVQACASRPSK